MTHFLVQNARAAANLNIVSGDVVWTPASGCAERLRAAGFSCDTPESIVGDDEYSDFVEEQLAFRTEILACLESLERSDEDLAHVSAAAESSVYSWMLLFACRALILSRWMSHVGDDGVVAGDPTLTPLDGYSLQASPYDDCFASIAARLSETEALRVHKVAGYSKADFWRDFNEVDWRERVLNILNRPLSSLLHQVKRRLAPDLGLGRGKCVLVLNVNELIEESAVALWRAGWRLRWASGPPRLEADAHDLRVVAAVDDLLSIWRARLSRWVSRSVAEAAADILRGPLERFLCAHPCALRAARSWAGEHAVAERPGELVCLSSGFYAPMMRLLDRVLLERGVPVVCTDHGSGMGTTARLMPVSDRYNSFSDVYVAYNAQTLAVFQSNAATRVSAYRVSGVPTVVRRARLAPLVRSWSRAMLGVPRKSRCVMYVTSLEQGNYVQGAGMMLDRAYSALQARVLDTLRWGTDHVIVKPYPAHRYPDPSPIWSEGAETGLNLAHKGEFRHHRWAADVLVLDLASSTLSWALGANVPLILLNSPTDPSTEVFCAAASEAIFFVDCREPEWEASLKALMSAPADELERRWAAMAPTRADFAEHFVLGPPSPSPAQVVQEAVTLARGLAIEDASDRAAAACASL